MQTEADVPLIVDPDAVLAFAVALQHFQAIGRRFAKIFQRCRVIERTQLALRDVLHVARQSPGD